MSCNDESFASLMAAVVAHLGLAPLLGLVQLLQASRQQACAAHQRLGKPVVRAPQYSVAALSRLMRQQS
jgi:hypothetical protein